MQHPHVSRGSWLLNSKQLPQSKTLHWQAESTVQRADGVMRYTVITITLLELLPAWGCTYTVAQQSSRAMHFSMKSLLCKITTNALRVVVYRGSAWEFKAMHFKWILLFSAASFGHHSMHKWACRAQLVHYRAISARVRSLIHRGANQAKNMYAHCTLRCSA